MIKLIHFDLIFSLTVIDFTSLHMQKSRVADDPIVRQFKSWMMMQTNRQKVLVLSNLLFDTEHEVADAVRNECAKVKKRRRYEESRDNNRLKLGHSGTLSLDAHNRNTPKPNDQQ